MAKYEKLGSFLAKQASSEIAVTFAEIERVIGQPLPRSARYPAWWSNHPSNNVMTKIWLDAGFKTAQVDVAGKKLVFRRAGTGMAEAGRPYAAAKAVPEGVSPTTGDKNKSGLPPFYGSMKGLITIAPGVDLTKPAADPKSWKFRG
jgi:peptidoglycan/xylan/chitin deacetylase (PgdA/CDA1 family)